MVDPVDPFALFGLTPAATLAELRAARRRLAQRLHPDRADGNELAMRQVNQAFDLAVRRMRARGSAPDEEEVAQSPVAPATGSASRRPRRSRWIEIDEPSFSIELLPAMAFEALVVVATWHGEVVDDDPPYALDAVLQDPAPCWCRFVLVPEAGGSMVTLAVGGIDGSPTVPSATEIRDLFVAELNTLSIG